LQCGANERPAKPRSRSRNSVVIASVAPADTPIAKRGGGIVAVVAGGREQPVEAIEASLEIPRAAMSPAASGGRTVEPAIEEGF
jgi:hypothetical protein